MKNKIKSLFLALLLFTHQTTQPRIGEKEVVGLFAVVAGLYSIVLLRTLFFSRFCKYNCHRFVRFTNPDNFFWKRFDLVWENNKGFEQACLANSKETIAELIKYPTFDIQENLMWVVKNNLVEVAQLLLARSDVDLNKEHYGQTFISTAVKNGHTAIVELLLNDERIEPNTSKVFENPLYCAIQKQQLDVLQILLKNPKVNKNIVIFNQNMLYTAIEKDWLEGVKLIIPYVDIQEKYLVHTALHYAAQKNAAKVFAFLLSIPELDIKATNCYGTCLDIAVIQGCHEIVQLLRDRKKFTELQVRQSLIENIRKSKTISVIKNIPAIQGVNERENCFFTCLDESFFDKDFENESLGDFYITTQGNLNKRNAQMLRPLDITYQWYISKGMNKSNDENQETGKARKNVYFDLLELTPSWSRATLQDHFKQWLPTDVNQKIMAVYVGLQFPEVPQKKIFEIIYPQQNTNRRLILS